MQTLVSSDESNSWECDGRESTSYKFNFVARSQAGAITDSLIVVIKYVHVHVETIQQISESDKYF